MVRKGAPPPPDLLIAELADRQHGTVERVQLAALGLTAGAVDKRVQRGRLFPMHRGVYAVGRRGLNVRGHWMAAVLALGGGAVLSHRAAAALWGLREPPTGRIDVTVPSPSGRKRRRDIAVHRSATMAAHHVTSRDRIPVTTVPRTLLDLAAVEPGARSSALSTRPNACDSSTSGASRPSSETAAAGAAPPPCCQC